MNGRQLAFTNSNREFGLPGRDAPNNRRALGYGVSGCPTNCAFLETDTAT